MKPNNPHDFVKPALLHMCMYHKVSLAELPQLRELRGDPVCQILHKENVLRHLVWVWGRAEHCPDLLCWADCCHLTEAVKLPQSGRGWAERTSWSPAAGESSCSPPSRDVVKTLRLQKLYYLTSFCNLQLHNTLRFAFSDFKSYIFSQ